MVIEAVKRLLPQPLKPPLRAARVGAREAAAIPQLISLQRRLRREWGASLLLDVHPRDEMAIYGYSRVSPRSKIKYFTTGPQNMRELQAIFDDQGIDLSTVGEILDFAGGFARLTRYLVQAAPRGRVTHSDIDSEAVMWVGEHLHIRSFPSTARPENLYHDGRYDLILAISLFSHLPIANWGGWLERLTGLLVPGGRLLFTTQGARTLAEITPEMRVILRHEAEGFDFVPVNETLGRLPEEQYGSSYLSPEWVAQHILKHHLGILVGTYPNSLWGSQDAYVVAKR